MRFEGLGLDLERGYEPRVGHLARPDGEPHLEREHCGGEPREKARNLLVRIQWLQGERFEVVGDVEPVVEDLIWGFGSGVEVQGLGLGFEV